MLAFPWLAVTFVKGDAGMAVCFLLFFADVEVAIETDITGIAKSHHAGIQKMGKASSKLSDFHRKKITGCGAERLYAK